MSDVSIITVSDSDSDDNVVQYPKTTNPEPIQTNKTESAPVEIPQSAVKLTKKGVPRKPKTQKQMEAFEKARELRMAKQILAKQEKEVAKKTAKSTRKAVIPKPVEIDYDKIAQEIMKRMPKAEARVVQEKPKEPVIERVNHPETQAKQVENVLNNFTQNLSKIQVPPPKPQVYPRGVYQRPTYTSKMDDVNIFAD